ncbi:uncharacterized protein PV07_11585 [Cladophialophora immunda]|uniref:Uncharacterized protein n=1 Tax=Cladophialophora immunda TaxID=569365 RepID=A0A0D2CII6_9EURO|nr:uncharacterized protein PV07_11585 [Cladophialophora immunda]KIW23379.1 hypothetical protein PV07_11585 [Cladophialophora immunda]
MESRPPHTPSNTVRRKPAPDAQLGPVAKYTPLRAEDEVDPVTHPTQMHQVMSDPANVSESESQEGSDLIGDAGFALGQQPSKEPFTRAVIGSKSLNDRNNIAESCRPWEPFWHRRSVLGAFLLLFVLLIVALGVLYQLSEAWNGFSTGISSNVYTWKYGPTVVLTAVAILWQKVCYTSKIISPWQSMFRASGGHGGQTLLVDYITPMFPAIMSRAVKNRHWGVLAAESGRLLLMIATGFSTGLLVLSAVPMLDTGVPIHLNSTFSAAGVSGQYGGAPNPSVDGVGAGNIGNLSFLDTTLRNYYGASHGDLPFSFGTTATMAYDTFIVDQSLHASSLLTVTLDAFLPDFQCHIPVLHNPLPIQYTVLGSEVDPLISLDIEVEGCVPTLDTSYTIMNSNFDFTAHSRTIEGDWEVIYMQCPSGLEPAWLLAVTDGRYTQLAYNQSSFSYNYLVNIVNISIAVCRPTYSIKSSAVIIDPAAIPAGTGVQLQSTQNGTTRMLDNFNTTNTLLAFESIIMAGSDLTLAPLAKVANTTQMVYPYPYFSLLADHYGKSSLEPFLDPENMVASAQAVYQGVMVQFAHKFLTQPQNTTVQSQQHVQENRLFVKLSPLVVMATAFGLLAVCTTAILINRATGLLPRNPDNAASQAAILTSSADLLLLIRNTGHFPDSKLNDLLAPRTFRCTVVDDTDSPRVVVEPQLGKPANGRQPATQDRPYWQPFAISWRFMALNFITPAGVVIVLEVLQGKSADTGGICSISMSSSIAHLLSTIVPACVMILISTMSQSVDSAISIFSPFAKLQSGASHRWRPTADSPLAHMPLRNLFAGAWDMNPSLSFSSVTRFLAPFLTIIVAALYKITPYEIPTLGSVRVTSHVNSNWTSYDGATSDGTAGISLGLIEQQGAPYPPFTFDELAFPEFTIPASTQVDNVTDEGVTVTLPATRASLDCVFVPPEKVTANVTDSAYSCEGQSCLATMLFQTNISAKCADQLYAPLLLLPNDGAGAYASGIWLTFWSKRQGWYSEDCPTIGFYFGHLRVNDTAPLNVTTMMCWQDIEEVDATVAFLPPSMKADPSRPPTVDESTRRTVKSKAQLYTAELIADNLPLWQTGPPQGDHPARASLLYADLEPLHTTPATGYSGSSSVESFFQTMILGGSGIDPEDLMGVENQSRFFTATQHLYRKYMALYINANMREAYATGARAPVYNATFYSGTGLRLIQNNSSKIALQAILGTMILCSLLAYATLPIWNIRRSLPHNPCTIAGMMSFLAGDSVCSRDVNPVGAEFMTDQQLNRVFADRVFAMGWWFPAAKGEVLASTKSRWRFDRAADKEGARFGIGVQNSTGMAK